MLKRIGILFSCIFAAVFIINLALATLGFAQEAAAPAAAPLWKALLDMAIKSLVPALWVAIGPGFVVVVTAAVNKFAQAYVPREIQVVLAGLITATLAGLTGGDPAAGMVQGVSAQTLAATHPDTLLTSAPKS